MRRLQKDFGQIRTSNLYLSEAIGFKGDDFLNLALALNTTMSLADLLEYTDELEKEAGRVRVYRGRYDSRTLDIDVVMFGDLQGLHNGREWPSEDINENAHVLLPMSEIAGEKRHPALGIRFNQLWQEFNQDAQQLTRVERFW
ncbi:MAG: 2-amino-4-hydroxy-6-hydroxymethyldihydropteridine diphosphokinase [Cryomorphaceae bacterium]